MTELEKYQEAIAPLRMADQSLLKETIAGLHSMSPTHFAIANVIENLMTILIEPEPVVIMETDSTSSQTDSMPKLNYYVCRDCANSFCSSKAKRKCPKCKSYRIKRFESA